MRFVRLASGTLGSACTAGYSGGGGGGSALDLGILLQEHGVSPLKGCAHLTSVLGAPALGGITSVRDHQPSALSALTSCAGLDMCSSSSAG